MLCLSAAGHSLEVFGIPDPWTVSCEAASSISWRSSVVRSTSAAAMFS